MTSADFSQFVVTARLLYMKPRLRDLPSYGRTLSDLYPLGLLSAVRIVIGLLLLQQHYPCLPAFYQVLVHRANRLPPASFRFHLTMDTLAFGCNLPTIRAVWGLAPVRVRSCWANKIKAPFLEPFLIWIVCSLSKLCNFSNCIYANVTFISTLTNEITALLSSSICVPTASLKRGPSATSLQGIVNWFCTYAAGGGW